MWGRFVICPWLFFREYEQVTNLFHEHFNTLVVHTRSSFRVTSAEGSTRSEFADRLAASASSQRTPDSQVDVRADRAC